MSVDEIQRIMNHLDKQDEKIGKIQNDIARILVTVADVPTVVNKLNEQETSIRLMKADHKNCQNHCEAIQVEKKEHRAPWKALAFYVAGATIMLLVGKYLL